jgi:hypothetical protein
MSAQCSCDTDSLGVQEDAEGMALGPWCEWKKVTIKGGSQFLVEWGKFLVIARPV